MSERTIWVDRVPSTQDMLHELAAGGAVDGTAVVAVEQTAGRGSRGRSWVSGRGGLWLSVLARPVGRTAPEALSVRVALAIADALERTGIGDLQVKWPNDLLLDGRKIGGILSEARWVGDRLAWVAIGVGINVTNQLPAELREIASTLSVRYPAVTAGQLAGPVIEAVRAAPAFATPLSERERAHFAARDALVGRPLEVPGGGTGAADGLEPDGALRIRRPDGRVEIIRLGPAVTIPL